MQNFYLEFAYSWSPWLLLLMIPAIALTVIPYFLLNKKLRKTRNRIISIVLHLVIMLLAICVLSGMTFVYHEQNLENELLLLVDVSDTENPVSDIREEYVRTLVEGSEYDNLRVGVVTFGFDQVYAAQFSYNVDKVYEDYLNADLPDTSATDIAAALRYAQTLFKNPESAKIVLITDGKETDERARSVIGSIVAQGTLVDCVYIPSQDESDLVQVMGVEYPDRYVGVNEDCEIGVTIKSRAKISQCLIELYDNDSVDLENGQQVVDLNEGEQTITFHTFFREDGLHEVRLKLSYEDGIGENNEYCSYFYLETFNKVLIIEQKSGESELLKDFLENDEKEYSVDVLNLKEEEVPTTIEELLVYDQIILNNISNKDLESCALDELIYSYVHDYGGGLFTAGGSEEDGTAHSYNRADMVNSLYQQMLPVQAIDYTPPVGVVIVIDISGSMSSAGQDGFSKLYWAKQGAIACLEALTERDYVGIMTLNTSYGTVLPMTRRTHDTVIKAAIEGIDGTGGTEFSQSIVRAGQMLVNANVDRRHIIIVSDGAPAPSDEEKYLEAAADVYKTNETTLSLVGIGMAESDVTRMQKLVETGHGKLHNVPVNETSRLLNEMRDDLNADEIKEVIDEPFYPQVADALSRLLDGVQYGRVPDQDGNVINDAIDVTLGGFYGVRARASAEIILTGNFEVPLYAQWKFGSGMVGCFMSDLNGRWSSEFMQDENGKRFLSNVVSGLMPLENIHPKDIRVEIREENYINQLSVRTTLTEGQYLTAELVDVTTEERISLGTVTDLSQMTSPGVYVTQALTGEVNEKNVYTARCTFVIKQNGVYRLDFVKHNADGSEVENTGLSIYKSFAYSHEYLMEEEAMEGLSTLTELVARSKGNLIINEEDSSLVFEDLNTSIKHVFDPRWLFISIAIILFLLDVAVRKFKFKWPHEIIRERKERKNMFNSPKS